MLMSAWEKGEPVESAASEIRSDTPAAEEPTAAPASVDQEPVETINETVASPTSNEDVDGVKATAVNSSLTSETVDDVDHAAATEDKVELWI